MGSSPALFVTPLSKKNRHELGNSDCMKRGTRV